MLRQFVFKPNTLYHGDCLDVMSGWETGCVDLIYLDPPFNSSAKYSVIYGKDSAGKPRDEPAQFTAFKDTWFWNAAAARRVHEISRATAHPAHKAIKGLAAMLPETGMLAYLVYMADRIATMRRVLKDTGSLYLHCDSTASHYLKIVMDEIFGKRNFRNEIIWFYPHLSSAKRHFPRKHDSVFFYTASDSYTFNADDVRETYDEQTLKRYKKPVVFPGGYQAKPNPKGRMPYDVWQIPLIRNVSKEKLGYPTQKPVALLERIVAVSSNEGDIVLDPFCGCGTTAEAAYKLKRKLIGIDISPYAITRVCRDRLKHAGGVSIQGLPTDMKSTRAMAEGDRFLFEQWAVTTLPGFEPNEKQTGDGGIDGRGYLLHSPEGEEGRCVVQVKSGGYTPDNLRALLSKITGGHASLGIFVTMEKMGDTKTARACAADAGQLQEGAKTFDRMMFWSMEEYFANAQLQLPAMAHPRTGKAMSPDAVPVD
ncbi:MAG: DNA methyltransferase [bacterium]